MTIPLLRPGRAAVDLLGIAGLALLYYASARLGLTFAYLHESASPVWPPTGIAIAAVLMMGPRVWPGVFIGAFLANLTTAGTPVTSAVIAGGNTLEALAAGWAARRFAAGPDSFQTPHNTLAFAALSGMLATTISPTLGLTALAAAGFAPWPDYGAIWLTWWLGDLAGALVVAPALLLWWADPRLRLSLPRALEAAALLAALLLAGQIVFGTLLPEDIRTTPLSYLCLPLIVLISLRFGPRAAATAMLILSALAVRGSMVGHGPFAGGDQNESLVFLQAFLAITSLMSMTTAAVVADRRAVARALARSEERLRAVIENAMDAIVVADTRGKVLSWSPSAESIFGWSAPEIIGRTLSETVVPEEDRRAHEEGLRRRVREGGVPAGGRRIEVTALHREGRRFPVELAITPLGAGRDLVFSAFIRDITDRRESEEALRQANLELNHRAEALARSNADLERFGYIVSHDLQEPLRMVSSYLQLLERKHGDRLTPEALDFIGYAVDGARRMQTLIMDLLAYSRVGRGAGALQPVDCSRPLAAATANLRLVIEESDATIEIGPMPTVLGEPMMLAQLFQNLLENAIKFRGPSPPRIEITSERDGDRWAIVVRDNGIGIDPRYAHRIFEIFQRLHTREEYPGTGIGLAIAKRIVERHDGEIRVESEPGRGAAFIVLLPAAPSMTPGAGGHAGGSPGA